MGSILKWRKYKIDNVPSCLRQLADRIESGDTDAQYAVVVWEDEEGDPNYAAFGKEISRSQVVGALTFMISDIMDGH